MVTCAPARLRGPHIKTERAGAANAVGKFEFVSICIFYARLRGSSPAYMLGVSRGVCPLVIAGLARGSVRGRGAELATLPSLGSERRGGVGLRWAGPLWQHHLETVDVSVPIFSQP